MSRGKAARWSDEMDETLIALAAKYPRGKTSAWADVLKDPLWKWRNLTSSQLAHRYKTHHKPTKKTSTTNLQPQIAPINFNFCPNCGFNLSPLVAALLVNQLTNGAANHA